MDFSRQREDMVEYQIAARGISDERILQAFRAVQREEFVPEEIKEFAYEDAPLPIGQEQTISQPKAIISELPFLNSSMNTSGLRRVAL